MNKTPDQAYDESEKISAALDDLACALLEECYTTLAEGENLWPLLAVEDTQGERELIAFSDDEPSECLIAARNYLRMQKQDGIGNVSQAVRYALGYDGLVQDNAGNLCPAVIVEFGEEGLTSAYSAYSFYGFDDKTGEFFCSEPAPAGEEESLLDILNN